MDSFKWRTDGDWGARSTNCEDGDGDSDGAFGTDYESSLYRTVRSPLPASSLPSLSDAGHGGVTPETAPPLACSLKPRKDRREDYRCRGCPEIFLIFVAVILLPPTLIVITDIAAKSSSSNYNTMLFPDHFGGRGSSSLSLAQHWFQTQQRRFLQDLTDTENVSNGTLDNNAETELEFADNTPGYTNNETVDTSDNEIDPSLNESNETEASDIVVLLPPGVGQDDEEFFELIDAATNTTGSSTIGDPTAGPTRSYAPSPSPSVTSSASSESNVSPGPMATASPTSSPAPSFHPSSSPSSVPTLMPSNIPTESPTSQPSDQPSISVSPSAAPSVSTEPSISTAPSTAPSTIKPTLGPSSAPSVATQNITNKGSIMKLRLINVPSKLNDEQIRVWENVTSKHIVHYHNAFATTYENNTNSPLIIGIDTTLRDQIPFEEEQTNEDEFVASPQGRIELQRIPGTLIVEMIYDQWAIVETNSVNLTKDQLRDRLFVAPFKTNSFDYGRSLYEALNWSTPVFVDVIVPVPEPEQEETVTIGENLTQLQVFAISISIIIAACLIVLFLLWERNLKGNARRGEESVSINSSIRAMPENPVGTGIPWNNAYYNGNSANDATADETVLSSARSAPGHLRRDTVERGILSSREAFQGKRARTGSKDSFPSTGIYGTEKGATMNSNVSSTSSNADRKQAASPQPTPMEENYGSPGIPLQVPVAIRGAGAPSITNRDNNNRPYLPPLPPPSSFGSGATPERARSMDDSLDIGIPVALNDRNSRAPTAFRRPPNRPFNMRLSGLSNTDIEEISILTEPFHSDPRRYSEEFVIPNPQINDAKYVASNPRNNGSFP